MTNLPIKMRMQESPTATVKEVLVYDFVTNTDTLETYVICWAIHSQNWVTVPLYCVEPITEKKPLNE